MDFPDGGKNRNSLGRIIGVADEIASSSTAIVNLTALGQSRRLSDHSHTNPYLLLHLMGRCRDDCDDGRSEIDGPAAIFYPAGSAHEMEVGARGLATIIIEFDPAWLRRLPVNRKLFDRPRKWLGGRTGRRATALAHAWLRHEAHDRLFVATEAFLTSLPSPEPDSATSPAWLPRMRAAVATDEPPDLDALADRFGVSRPWLTRAYRSRYGEGIGETVRRHRAERAVFLLECSDLPLATVAADTAFCDQSHMNRALKLLLGMTPAEIRARHLGFCASDTAGDVGSAVAA